MASPRNYGWTPEQLARINSVRQSKGQKPFIDTKMSDPDYQDRYSEKAKTYEAKNNNSGSVDNSERLSISERMEKEKINRLSDRGAREQKFRNKFNNPKQPMNKGVSTPIIKDSYSRIVT
jgi:hypothetical protein